MSRTARTIIFYVFLAVFLAAVPLVLLYTSGYRYNWHQGKIEQVGALLLKSTSRGATITLNNRPATAQTPTLLYLPPNEYQIKIQKDGYHDWMKTLPIASRETTFAEDIVLWKKTAPARIENQPLLNAFLSPDLHFAVSLIKKNDTRSTLLLLDLLTQKETELGEVAPDSRISFSPNNTSILIEEPTATTPLFSVIRLDSRAPLDLSEIQKRKFTNMYWNETDGTLYTSDRNTIFAINLYTDAIDPIAQGGVQFVLHGTEIWSIMMQDGKTVLAKSRAGEPDTKPQVLTELPLENYEFLPVDGTYLLLHQKNKNHILLIDRRSPSDILLDLPGSEVQYRHNRDGDLELLTWNSFELWRGNARTGSTELLRRQSDIISAAAWYPRGEYVLLASDNRIDAIELDNRDARNVVQLISFENSRPLRLSPDNRGLLLFFATADGADAGWYRLELQ